MSEQQKPKPRARLTVATKPPASPGGRFLPLATDARVYLDALGKAQDNGEASQAIQNLFALLLPWMKALKPETPTMPTLLNA